MFLISRTVNITKWQRWTYDLTYRELLDARETARPRHIRGITMQSRVSEFVNYKIVTISISHGFIQSTRGKFLKSLA